MDCFYIAGFMKKVLFYLNELLTKFVFSASVHVLHTSTIKTRQIIHLIRLIRF
uniref:Uncharacterized protein n=1 Tax=Arundo donax TaxID=35708 RepID=A0A0A9H8R4_ARUDO